YLRIFWRWRLLFLAFLLAIPIAAYLIERGKPKVYQSSTLVELQASAATASVFGSPLTDQNVATVGRLITTTGVADAAARFLHPPPADPGSLLGEISVSVDNNTGFITISAQDRSPQRAAAIANAFAAALDVNRANAAVASIDNALAGLVKQLAAVPAGDQVDRTQIPQQIARH